MAVRLPRNSLARSADAEQSRFVGAREGLTEVSPMRSDDEKQSADRKCDARDDRPSAVQLELGDLRSGEPDPSKQQKQKPELGETDAGVMRKGKYERHGRMLAQWTSRTGALLM